MHDLPRGWGRTVLTFVAFAIVTAAPWFLAAELIWRK